MAGVMTPKRVRLALWIGRPSADQAVPRLGLGDVLYSPPNPDGTRKRCGNCMFWFGVGAPAGTRDECFLHDAEVLAPRDSVCGYHVHGVGQAVARPPRQNMIPVLPEYSGLCSTDDGSSCDNCVYFTPTAGLAGTCAVASELDTDADGDPVPALVHRAGCCAAWRET